MQPKKSDRQRSFLCEDLLDHLDPRNHLFGLAKVIPTQRFENTFRPLYAAFGRPEKTVRLMVSFPILKQLENLSDERVFEAEIGKHALELADIRGFHAAELGLPPSTGSR